MPEEEAKKGDINDNMPREVQIPRLSDSLRHSMYMSFVGGSNSKNSQFDWETFKI